MKKVLLLVLLMSYIGTTAQQLVLKKGVVLDSIKVNDSKSESFSLYLPKKFEISKTWPVIFIFDIDGNSRRALSLFAPAAEKNGYVLAASNDLRDSLSISQNILISNRMFNTVLSLLPISKDRSYTAGFSRGASVASIIPAFFKSISGVISCGSPVANTEILRSKNLFHFVGIVGDKDFNYPDMLANERILNILKFPNQLLVFDGEHEWPSTRYLSKAMEYFTLAAMAKGDANSDEGFIMKTYARDLGEVSSLMSSKRTLMADHRLSQMIRVYRGHDKEDSLRITQKFLRKSNHYKSRRRGQNAWFFKEDLIMDNYDYSLEEDLLTYNYNNLGWWAYQMEKLDEYKTGSNYFGKYMGKRLEGYLNAIIADNIDLIQAEPKVDEEAVNFLRMLKTITAPEEFENYLNVISYNAKQGDTGTSYFYLQELLKQGYTNKDELYSLENISLLRITPEFNEIVQKYLKESRYGY